VSPQGPPTSQEITINGLGREAVTPNSQCRSLRASSCFR
jgi:hypothetical protein